MKPRLNIVTLGVNNLRKSKEFYENALGWEPAAGSDENIVFFNHGGIILSLYAVKNLLKMPDFCRIVQVFPELLWPLTRIQKKPLPKPTTKQLKMAPRHWLSHEILSGVDMMPILPILMDYRWEIAWAPFWKFDQQGSLILE